MSMFDEDDKTSNPELEAEFQELVDSIGAEIEVHLAAASKELAKAVALSEKHGVPFTASLSPLSQPYVPASFSGSKFSKLDNDKVSEIADVWGDYLFDGDGWLHSSIC